MFRQLTFIHFSEKIMLAQHKNALILGSSSGFGAATALALAEKGYNIYGVHLDRAAAKEQIDELIAKIQYCGVKVAFFNANAADVKKIKEITAKIKEDIGEDGKIRVLLHSLAFGTVLPFFPKNREESINKKQVDMTIDVMASSLLYWTQELFYNDLLAEGGRILAMTSSGSNHVLCNYGAVSAAKAALEAYIRQLTFELAPYKITANAIRAGVTDTAAARKIPGSEKMFVNAQAINPHRRLTTTEDVAKAIVLIIDEASYWINGNVIGVDGGEDVVNFAQEN